VSAETPRPKQVIERKPNPERSPLNLNRRITHRAIGGKWRRVVKGDCKAKRPDEVGRVVQQSRAFPETFEYQAKVS
jgi:hypothetical protein